MALDHHFHKNPTGCSETAESDPVILAARAQSDSYVQMIGPDAYERTPPDLFGFASDDAGLKRYLLAIFAEPNVHTPPEEVYLLRDAYVCALPVVFTRDRETFAPSLVDHHSVHPLEFFFELANGIVPTEDEPAILIFKAGTANYGHILVEMLPKLENVAPLVGEATKVLVPPLPGTLTDQLQEIVAMLYPGKFRIEPMRSPVLRVAQLLYPGPVSRHNARKSRTLLRFADRLRKAAPFPMSGDLPERIYVSREETSNRRMLNEPHVRACFEAHGYRAVCPERMTLLEQVNLFSAAKQIAGPLGAALTNILFAPEQAQIIMIDPGLYDLFFWDLSCLRQQSFVWHFTAPLAQFDIRRLHADYDAPVKPICQMLSTINGRI